MFSFSSVFTSIITLYQTILAVILTFMDFHNHKFTGVTTVLTGEEFDDYIL